jgi:tetratricopeptide (TPR) repeat protein
MKLQENLAALADLNTILSQNHFVNAYLLRARLYRRLNRLPEAIKDMTLLIHSNLPPAAGIYNERGWYFALAGQYAMSLLDLKKAIELDPQLLYSYGSRGHTYFLMGKFDEALADFDRQHEIKPDHPFAIAGQAVTQHALGSSEAAKSLWRKLIELDARYVNIEALIEDFHPAEPFIEAARKLIAEI